MHVLVSCDQCDRQYDTIGRAPGQKFRCICGEMNVVPEAGSYVADAVRCSACGGVRQAGSMNCGFCGTDFTVHEKDLNTVCSSCLSRISDKSRFCHHCATPVTVTGNAGDSTDMDCPHCRQRSTLTVRRMKSQQMTVLECTRCAGLWLDNALFSALEQRTIELAASGINGEYKTMVDQLPADKITDQNLYRKCPRCNVLMHRRNYGPGSGIVMDHCSDHGFWFDHQELSVILRWIRTGGLLASHKRRAAMQRDRDRLATMLEKMEASRRRHLGKQARDYFK